MMNRCAILAFLTILASGCVASTQDDGAVVYLEYRGLKAGFLPEVGGRLVFLGDAKGPNLLKADSSLWNEAEADRMEAGPHAQWKDYFGHIVWPGPQLAWWTRQDLNPVRKAREAPWPPDPYLIYGAYTVRERSARMIRMESPHSPVSGITLIKEYRLHKEGLEIILEMKNSSDREQSWDIWSNARFEASTPFFVPAMGKEGCRLESRETPWSSPVVANWEEGAFSFKELPPDSGTYTRSGKAFLHPGQGRMVAFPRGKMLVMDFPWVAPEDIHPEQGFVEVFLDRPLDLAQGLLELEHHTAYVNLQAGESNTTREFWHLLEVPDLGTMEERLAVYERMNLKP